MSEAAALEVVEVPVDRIDKNSWNPNQQSDVVARATRESLELYGFVEPVLLRPKDDGRYEMVNGEHRWLEAVGLGMETIPAVVRELSDADAKKLTVVLNETTGEADVVLLGQLLADLSSMEDFKVALPYTDSELEHLLSIGAEDWDRFTLDGAPLPEPPETPEHEVVLAFDGDRHEQFRGWVTILEKEWDANGVAEVVYEAVRRAALAASQGS